MKTVYMAMSADIVHQGHLNVINEARKLGLYMENGIIPSINFITTFETKKHPLTMDEIRNAIDRYILQ